MIILFWETLFLGNKNQYELKMIVMNTEDRNPKDEDRQDRNRNRQDPNGDQQRHPDWEKNQRDPMEEE